MFKKIIKKTIIKIFIYFLLPSSIFFYTTYLNDFFNLDLFHIKKMAELSNTINNLSNEIDWIHKEKTLENNYTKKFIGGVIITTILYVIYNTFTNYK